GTPASMQPARLEVHRALAQYHPRRRRCSPAQRRTAQARWISRLTANGTRRTRSSKKAKAVRNKVVWDSRTDWLSSWSLIEQLPAVSDSTTPVLIHGSRQCPPCALCSIPDSRMIVMKFGGTSVEDSAAIDRAAKIVAERRDRAPAVVVSAMSKVTDQLLAAGRAAGEGDRERALQLSRGLRERHYSTAGELLGTAVFTQFHSELESDFDALDELLRGISAVGELTPRTTDLIASFGERISSRMVTAAFLRRDLPAAYVDSRQCVITDANHTKAVPLFPEIDLRLAHHVRPLLDRKQIPVMGGFIGSTREGVTTTLGRGGSDFTAAIVGAGLDAQSIEIWTDVDGIMTTNPRICPDAHRIRTISFPEAAKLAYFGAKVLHP